MRRLHSRIFVHFLGVLLVAGLVSSAIFANGWSGEMLHNWTLRFARHAASLMVQSGDDPAKRAALVQQLSSELDLDVTLRGLDGELLAVGGKELPRLPPETLAEAHTHETFVHSGHVMYGVVPIRDSTGRVIAILQTFPMRRFQPEHLLRPGATLAVLLLVVAMATRPLARRISRPVERITEASRRLGGGDLSYRIPIDDHHHPFGRHHRRWKRHLRRRHPHRRIDELSELTRAWNDMAERVEGLVRGQRELLANVSHELRSPLARIRLALELLPGDDKTAARVEDVKGDLGELERLIDDVLTTARLEATGLPVHVDPVELAPLLTQLVERARIDPLTAGKEVRLAPGATTIGPFSADGALVKRALWNLVENAAKYGAAPITLAAERTEDRVRLTVSDEGAGIPAADRERVFDPFFRADKARTPGAARGFGLGLTLARRVAEVHGGTISIDAAHPNGTGCRVLLEIPLRM